MDYRFHLIFMTLNGFRNILHNYNQTHAQCFAIASSSSTMTHAAVHTLEEPSGGSVVFSVDPFLFIEVSLSAVKSQAISVVIQIWLVGFAVSVRSQAGLVSVLLAIGDVCLIKVSLYCVTARPQFGVIKVTPSSDTAIIQSMVSIHTASVMFTLCCATTKTPVIKLSVARATQAAVIQVPLSWPAQAGVIEVAGGTTPEAEVIEIKVEEAALCAGKCHKAAFCVPAAQVVIITCWCVRGGA